MTLDSLLTSLGSTTRNLGAHSFILVQQQQVAYGSHNPPQGCGGGLALMKCCWNRLSESRTTNGGQRTRGIIVLSLEHPSQDWLNQPLKPAPIELAPQRLILDACTQRFQATPSTAAATPSSSISLSSLYNTSVQTLQTHEIKNLQTLRSVIESAAKQMHAQYAASHTSSNTASSYDAASAPAPSSNPYSLESEAPEVFSCETVTLLIDDLMSLFVRFGTSPVLAWLRALKVSTLANLSIIANLDLDGLTTLSPLMIGTGTGNTQAQHSQVSIHTHLHQLATTIISIRSLQPLSHPTTAFTFHAQLVHQRPSGKVTHLVEEMELYVQEGLIKKAPQTTKTITSTPSMTAVSTASTAGASTSASLAQQFGSSFSLDLTSKAKSARANAILPYQHTNESGQLTNSVSSLDQVAADDDDLLTDDDEDFDDPDDDLEV